MSQQLILARADHGDHDEWKNEDVGEDMSGRRDQDCGNEKKMRTAKSHWTEQASLFVKSDLYWKRRTRVKPM